MKTSIYQSISWKFRIVISVFNFSCAPKPSYQYPFQNPGLSFEPTIVATMKEVGNWVKAHGDAIYGTRAGDFIDEAKYTSTQNGNITKCY
ncbi:MAG: hypothetical protein PF489_00230 [Salinivirgaceae bacterium]|jgi:hypothetical protein|nr:hypothetical protein [Salinivirgaceae bacterium]